jgi:hypothetical protein
MITLLTAVIVKVKAYDIVLVFVPLFVTKVSFICYY